MKVEAHSNRALSRINAELTKRALELDFEIIHVTGRNEQLKRRITALERPYALIQHSLRSTRNPHCQDWIELWNGALVVWSAYDLYQLARDDGLEPSFSFYHSPYGVDSNVFNKQDLPRRYIIGCSGDYMTEGVRECIKADMGRVMHLGQATERLNVDDFSDISDSKLADLYNRCITFSGLRRVEGFELPVAEALLCGAVPILYDKPHYRKWYSEFGLFIQETDRDDVIKQLRLALVDELPELNLELAKERFDWNKIIEGFYECVRSNYKKI